MTDYKEILRLHSQGIAQRSIATSCNCSRNTVANVLKLAKDAGISWPIKANMTNADLQKLLMPKLSEPSSLRKKPDYEYVHREMAKSGVTLSLLWNEYCEQCRLTGEMPLMYSQFCHYYREFVHKTKATMHIERKPGEQMEVDWAGKTASIVDTDTGELIPAYIFVGVLSSSGYAYVEAFLSQNQECWISAHINAFNFFCGVTRIIIPDNLKTGVEKASWYTPVINRTYHEMAEHYGTAIIPARVRRPKDKPHAEGSVNVVSTWILAALRNETFFTLSELNSAIRGKLKDLNSKPFQKKPGSRLSVFTEEEKDFLLPLPANAYELAIWKIATVQYNYHVAVNKMYYSVPHTYIKQKVDVRITRTVVEIFFEGERISSHPRLNGKDGQYSTVVDHMPEDHKKYTEWNAKRFVSWAESIGPNAVVVIKTILASYRVEQQGYRACMALLKLSEKYPPQSLETACKTALSYTPKPSFKSVQTILKSGNTMVSSSVPETKSSESFGFTRGAEYYGRKRGDK